MEKQTQNTAQEKFNLRDYIYWQTLSCFPEIFPEAPGKLSEALEKLRDIVGLEDEYLEER